MKLEPLTQEEQHFAETHLPLVNRFLHSKGLSESEYYDVVIFGYLEAVQELHRRPISPERQNFTALAEICMKTAVYREFRARIQDKRKVDLLALSLNAPLTDDTSRTLLDALPDNAHVVPKEFETVDLIARILSAATEREREAIALRISGYTSEEIAAKMNLNIHTVRKTFSNFRCKIRPMKDGNAPGKTLDQIHYETHRAECLERSRAYQLAHKDELRVKRRANWHKNKDTINAQRRAKAAAKRAAKKAASDGTNVESGLTPRGGGQ